MKNKDYELLINICQHSLRKGHDLNIEQVADIDRMIKVLYNEQQSRRKTNALDRSKKVGKRTRV